MLNLTPARILFWLSVVAFSIAFLYVTFLGMENLLRYYHIQNIEDRLEELVPHTKDDKNRNCFLHWNSFCAPLFTKNFKHLASSHAALSFISYVGSILLIIVFSLGLIMALYLGIEPIEWFDTLVLIFVGMLMFCIFYLFWRASFHAKKITQFAWDTAHENRKQRLNGNDEKIYIEAKTFRRFLMYLIYPRFQDLQKPGLIVLGFFLGALYGNIKIHKMNILWLAATIFIFDFLAYQARYQINDIRGIEEDKKYYNKNRLMVSDSIDEGRAIHISYKVAIIRIVLAITFTLTLVSPIRELLLGCLGILLLSTILYEYARIKQNKILIFILVGCGYPLRFF